MQHPRRQFLQLAATAAALPTVSRIARAQPYPTRPIMVIVPYGAGGLTDTVGRIIAEGMRGALGQSIIVENVAGASPTASSRWTSGYVDKKRPQIGAMTPTAAIWFA
jgi:tripartite-type tricarboxylate transporter receptor subunit TctC